MFRPVRKLNPAATAHSFRGSTAPPWGTESFKFIVRARARQGVIVTLNKSKNYLGEIVYRSRIDNDLTQDEFGSRYNVSGPAVFKFEKGYVRPSLELWLKMAADAGIPERRSVLLWLKSKLPAEYQEYVELQGAAVAEKAGAYKGRKKKEEGGTDYSRFEERKDMQEAAMKDKTLPKALRELLDDDELWSLFKPTGHEINMLRDVFGPLGRGSKSAYREALRLIREFTHSF